MGTSKSFASNTQNIVLIVEDDVIVRTALSEYLRHCGYQVIEAADEKEALQVFSESTIRVNILFVAILAFGLTQWVRQHRPGTQVVIAGDFEKAAHVAGDLCKDGPHLKKPYEPQQVIEWIKRLQASTSRK